MSVSAGPLNFCSYATLLLTEEFNKKISLLVYRGTKKTRNLPQRVLWKYSFFHLETLHATTAEV